jgi:hypothetical protein
MWFLTEDSLWTFDFLTILKNRNDNILYKFKQIFLLFWICGDNRMKKLYISDWPCIWSSHKSNVLRGMIQSFIYMKYLVWIPHNSKRNEEWYKVLYTRNVLYIFPYSTTVLRGMMQSFIYKKCLVYDPAQDDCVG